MATALAEMAGRLKVQEQELQDIILNTVMPTGKYAAPATREQFVSFLAVANEYRLNPLTKEVYAFPTKGGGIQPIVSIDGWLKIINNHPEFDGMEFEDSIGSDGGLSAVTCKIYRKDRNHPTSMTEYMVECKGTSEPWVKWPARMLRHKATIQAARYAFGLSGIIDQDEADRYQSAGVIEKDITSHEPKQYPQSDFEANFDKWKVAIESGRRSVNDLVSMIESKGKLTNEMKAKLMSLVEEGETNEVN
jgi:phage recombination protein Bet